MADYTAYFKGAWVPRDELKIDVGDRGFMSSDVVFDICRTFNGKSLQTELPYRPALPFPEIYSDRPRPLAR